jgi:thermosome
MSQLAGPAVLILKEGTTRRRGKEAQRNNMMAAITISDVVRSTLGPKGMDKMLVDSLGDITITNDGATILKEVDVQHPAAKMMVEISKTQDKMVGDGTTSAVVLAGELLKKSDELLDQEIHPTVIVGGYRKAADKAIEVLNRCAREVKLDDEETLKKIAETSMYSKAAGSLAPHFSKIAIEAVRMITEKRGDKNVADVSQIQVIKKAGKSLTDTELVKGVIIDKEVVHPDMPKKVAKAKMALLDCPLEIEKTEFSAEIRIKDPLQMKAFLDEESTMLKTMVDKVAKSGANVVFCQKGIDDTAQHFLAKQGILAARRVKQSDMEKLARASGGRIVTNLDDLKPADLGSAELVEEQKVGEDKMIFVRGCKDPKSVAILIRGGLERVVDEAERTMHDALSVVADVTEENKAVTGGGAIEAEIAKELRSYAAKVGGREQLAIEAFSEAVEIIPRTLAENAGLDPIDIMVSLRSAHEKPDGSTKGVNVHSGKIVDMWEEGIIEPLKVKRQAIRSATEAATMILRIDDVIAAAKPPPEKKGPPSPEEMGEY